MRRPSITFINRVYPPGRGATGRVLRDLAKAFTKEGWQVTVITSGPKPGKERDGAVRVIRVKGTEKSANFIGYMLIWLRLFWAALRQPSSHILVTMTDPPLIVVAGSLLKKIKRCRHIHWCHDLYPDILPALNVKIPKFFVKFFKKRSRRAMKKADKVIVIGRCMARHLAYDGLNPANLAMVPNWPDFELSQEEKTVNGNSHTLPQNFMNGVKSHDDQIKAGPRFRVMYAGNLGRAHPIDTIIDAAEILQQDCPDIEFVFVGDSPGFDALVQARTCRGLDNIRLMPYQPLSKLKQTLESGDVHLVSMDEDVGGLLVPCKLYSALAVHRPCIFVGPSLSEAAKVIHDFEAGAVVPQGDPQALAHHIKRFRMNSDDWFSARGGAAIAGQVFTGKDSINAWIERAWSVVKNDVGESRAI